MKSSPSYRITPWVGRLILANAMVMLLLMTLFTSPDLLQALTFSPRTALIRPWTFVSYMFVHAGLLHLLANMLMLFVFGAAVESRMGSRNFILYYLFCGVGAAVFALLLASVIPVSPFIGASDRDDAVRRPGRSGAVTADALGGVLADIAGSRHEQRIWLVGHHAIEVEVRIDRNSRSPGPRTCVLGQAEVDHVRFAVLDSTIQRLEHLPVGNRPARIGIGR